MILNMLRFYNIKPVLKKLGCLYFARKGYDEVFKKEPHDNKVNKHLKKYEKLLENFKLETMQSRVQQILSFEGPSDNKTKICVLKEIEQNEYRNLVKQFAYKKSEEELKSLVIILNDLGYLTTKLGDLSKTMEGDVNEKLKYYTDAAIIYQYINTIIDEKLNEITVEDKMAFITQQRIYPQEQLSHLQELIISEICGDREAIPFVRQIKDYKQSLKTLRNDIEQKLQRAENIRKLAINNQEEKQKYQGAYVEEVSNLFKTIADNMQKFLGELYSDSEREIGGPPCKYAVIGLGSMALRQMTPYSDLEFAILTENEDYKQSKDPIIKHYFKNLSHLVHFKVINLGESVIPTSKYGVDLSHLIHRGVNFDLGGKTPLGRIDNDKQYELVQTIGGMLAYVRNKKNKAEHTDKNLPYILENVCYVHGDKQLVTSYREEVKKFLTSKNESDEQGRLNCEIRAIKLLEEGTVELNYLQQTPGLKFKESHFEGDLHNLAPNLGVENEGRLFDVKQEIYRLPDRLIYNLGLYYGIEGDSNWDIVDKLKDENIITPEAATNLKNAITFATILRLKTYSCHKAQKEDMSIFSKCSETENEIKEQAEKIFHLSDEDLREQGGLFHYFYTALPLHERLEAFCAQYNLLGNADRRAFFQSSDFYVDDHASKGLIYYRLAQYKKAQTNLEQALNDPKYYDNFTLQNFLGMLYLRINDYERACKRFGNCLDKLKLIYKEEPHPDVVISLNNLGSAYYSIGQYDQAIKYFDDSLKMKKLINNEESDLDVAKSLNNLGLAYYSIGQKDQAFKYFEESLKMKKIIYKEKSHPDVALSLNNLGSAYNDNGKYDQAIENIMAGLNMKKLIFKEEPHPNVANSLSNLGLAYYYKGQYDQAIIYYKDSLKMVKLFYKEEPHLDVATYLNNLGLAYYAKGDYDKAIEYLECSLEIVSLIYKEEPHLNSVGFLNNLGLAYYNKGQYDQAINYYEDGLKMLKLIYKEEQNPHAARLLSNIGSVYYDKGQYDQAIKYFEDSLKIIKLKYKEEPHPDIASSLNNLGLAYSAKGQYDLSIKYFKDSQKMAEMIHKKEPYPGGTNLLNNLGVAYGAKGQYDHAIRYFEECLKMGKLIYMEEPHPEVARPLKNLGLAFCFKGQYDQAIKYLEDSLKVIKLIYKEEPHPDVASTLSGLGSVFIAKGQYDQAIRYYEDSLKMNKLVYKEEPHPNVAHTLFVLGIAYCSIGQYDQAIKYHEDSLRMKKIIYKEEPRPDVADSLNNLGIAYSAKGQYDQGIKYLEDSLRMIELIYKEETHPDVAKFLNNLGIAYSAKGQYDQAIKYHEECLRMNKLICNEEPHPDVANSLDNLGSVYSAKGQYDQAIKYHEDCLRMKKLIYKEETHPAVAKSLNKLENAYREKEKYDPAISYGNQVLQILSFFMHHPYINLIKVYFIKFTLLFIKNFSSDPQELSNHLIELAGENYHNTEFWLAVEEWDRRKIQELITAGVDPDNVPFMSTTPLIRAIVKGDVEMVSLISEKANINKPDNDRNKVSPLYYSLGYCGHPINVEIVKLLLEKDADVSQAMYDGNTPMHMAHYKGNEEAIKLLLSYKADINAKNGEGKTPLLCLLEQGDLSSETKREIIRKHYQICDDKTIKDQEGNVVIDNTLYHSLKLELFFNSNEVFESNHLPQKSTNSVTSDHRDLELAIVGDIHLPGEE